MQSEVNSPTASAETPSSLVYPVQQRCLVIKERLIAKGFGHYFPVPGQDTPADPVADIEQFCSSGWPLCELYNLLSGSNFFDPISIHDIPVGPSRHPGRAFARFRARITSMRELNLTNVNLPLDLDEIIQQGSLVIDRVELDLKSTAAISEYRGSTLDSYQDFVENSLVAENLFTQVLDWKGCDPQSFGKLYLHDYFTTRRAKRNSYRQHRVFLFEHTLLFCQTGDTSVHVEDKSNGIPFRFILKGRVLIPNVNRISLRDISTDTASHSHPLTIWWQDRRAPDFCTLWCEGEERQRRWLVELFNIARRSSNLEPSQTSLSCFNSQDPEGEGRLCTVSSRTNQ
ncbi:hypothetical protein HGRIS_000931 [Hohenbuehelia grisea]|uniref:PH domain-containing protein n=1 Tax=Hohenbuehelia grisea TaxID=104357 RepID=A0ABR3IQ53_9AGAR